MLENRCLPWHRLTKKVFSYLSILEIQIKPLPLRFGHSIVLIHGSKLTGDQGPLAPRFSKWPLGFWGPEPKRPLHFSELLLINWHVRAPGFWFWSPRFKKYRVSSPVDNFGSGHTGSFFELCPFMKTRILQWIYYGKKTRLFFYNIMNYHKFFICYNLKSRVCHGEKLEEASRVAIRIFLFLIITFFFIVLWMYSIVFNIYFDHIFTVSSWMACTDLLCLNTDSWSFASWNQETRNTCEDCK